MKKIENDNELNEMIDENFIADPEDKLWVRLEDYFSREILTDERQDFAKVIYTLNEKFGYTFGQISQKTGGTKKAGTLAIQMRKYLGQGTPSIQRKAGKVANKSISDIIGTEVAQTVVTYNELGRVLVNTYDPIAKALNIPLDQFIAQTVDYYISEKPVLDELVEKMFFKALDQKMTLEYLRQIASPNFLASEKMMNITHLTESIILTKAFGQNIPDEVFMAYAKELDRI